MGALRANVITEHVANKWNSVIRKRHALSLWCKSRFSYFEYSIKMRRDLWAVLTFVMGLTTATTPAILRGVSGAADRMTRHDIGWTGQSGRLELDDLTYAALEYRWSPGAANQERLRAAHSLLLTRIEDWTMGPFGAFIEMSPERIALLEDIASHALKAESLFARLNEPVVADNLFTLLARIDPLMQQMAGQALASDIREKAVSGDTLLHLQRIYQRMTLALFAASVLFAWLVVLRKGITVTQSSAHHSL